MEIRAEYVDLSVDDGTTMRAYVARQEKAGLTQTEARRQVCRVLLNLNEFVYPD